MQFCKSFPTQPRIHFLTYSCSSAKDKSLGTGIFSCHFRYQKYICRLKVISIKYLLSNSDQNKKETLTKRKTIFNQIVFDFHLFLFDSKFLFLEMVWQSYFFLGGFHLKEILQKMHFSPWKFSIQAFCYCAHVPLRCKNSSLVSRTSAQEERAEMTQKEKRGTYF